MSNKFSQTPQSLENPVLTSGLATLKVLSGFSSSGLAYKSSYRFSFQKLVHTSQQTELAPWTKQLQMHLNIWKNSAEHTHTHQSQQCPFQALPKQWPASWRWKGHTHSNDSVVFLLYCRDTDLLLYALLLPLFTLQCLSFMIRTTSQNIVFDYVVLANHKIWILYISSLTD